MRMMMKHRKKESEGAPAVEDALESTCSEPEEGAPSAAIEPGGGNAPAAEPSSENEPSAVSEPGKGGASIEGTPDAASRGASKGYVMIAVVYLLGLVMGALDMSIVNPARTVIQNSLSVDDSLGVWVITIYTLMYAASIPIMGKLADRHGRKVIYMTCIFLFGFGSLLCGLSRSVGSFEMLILARCVQAIGGGGIMPIATAEFGTAFPEEKRGMALGMVGMVYGLAAILGPSAGSGILDLFGPTEWQFIFYINVPICLVVVLIGLRKLPNAKMENVKPIDGLGTLILTIMTLSLMYGLKNIDFFDLGASITSLDVYPFLIAFVVLLPLFIWRETKAADPIINLAYFKNVNIVIALACSVISGLVMMGTIFFPQFCENAMLMRSGSGGYFIALLGLGSAVGSMGSGGLIDKFGVRPVLAGGFLGSAAGSMFMAFVACQYPSLLTVCATMLITGLGLGFVMGTPLNYMMLENTPDDEANSALATLSLVRSIGTAIAPALMVAFVVHASSFLQDDLMDAMPQEVEVSPLPYAQEIDQKMDELRADEETADMLDGIDIPRLSDYRVMEVQMDNEDSDLDVEISDDVIEEMKNSDVTTIVNTCKSMASDVFSQIKPQLMETAQSGIQAGLASMREKSGEMADALNEMSDGLNEMDDGLSEMDQGIAEMNSKINSTESKIDELSQGIEGTQKAISGISTGIDAMNAKVKKMESDSDEMQSMVDGLKAQIKSLSKTDPDNPQIPVLEAKVKEAESAISGMKAGISGMKASIKESKAKKAELEEAAAGMKTGKKGATAGKSGMKQGLSEMQSARSDMAAGREDLVSAQAELSDARASLEETIGQLEAVSEAIPGMFDEAEAAYLEAIDGEAEQIQKTYQATLNSGFKDMAIFVGICALVGAFLVIPYRDKRPRRKDEK